MYAGVPITEPASVRFESEAGGFEPGLDGGFDGSSLLSAPRPPLPPVPVLPNRTGPPLLLRVTVAPPIAATSISPP